MPDVLIVTAIINETNIQIDFSTHFIMNISRMERDISTIHGSTFQEEIRATHWIKKE